MAMHAWRPERADAWQALRLFGACALAYGVGRGLGLRETVWAVITAVIVTQPMLADTLAAGRDRVIGTLIGAAVGFLVLELARHGLPLLPLFWIALAPLTLLVAMRPYLRLSAVTLAVVVLLPGNGSPFTLPFERVIEILCGTIAAVIVAALIRPSLWRKGGDVVTEAPEKAPRRGN